MTSESIDNRTNSIVSHSSSVTNDEKKAQAFIKTWEVFGAEDGEPKETALGTAYMSHHTEDNSTVLLIEYFNAEKVLWLTETIKVETIDFN